jgi:hypothetical protein
MNKLIFIALGIASASAAYEYNYAPFSGNNANDYFDFEFGVLSDAYYTTTYESDSNDQSYGILIDSYITLQFYFELFNWYRHEVDFKFTPLRIAPYTQDIMFTRPVEMENGDSVGAHTYLGGTREIVLFDVVTTHIENMKVCGASFWDAIDNDN